jgi:hypothetical protein
MLKQRVMKHHNLRLFGVSFTSCFCTYQSVDQHERWIVLGFQVNVRVQNNGNKDNKYYESTK